jgi:hypothetical protein
MAWAWPSITLKDDAKLYYTSIGALSLAHREVSRFLEITLLGATDGAAKYKKLTGIPSRFDSLTGDVRTVALLLGSVVREGVLCEPAGQPDGDDVVVQRDGLELLFTTIKATRGKSGEEEGVAYHTGDQFDLDLFAHGPELVGGEEDYAMAEEIQARLLRACCACLFVPACAHVFRPHLRMPVYARVCSCVPPTPTDRRLVHVCEPCTAAGARGGRGASDR